VSIHMHCTQLVMSLNTIYQLVFWSVSQTPLPALSSTGPFEATSLCARARAKETFIINCGKVQRINLGYAWNVSPNSDIHKITKHNTKIPRLHCKLPPTHSLAL
jgi:hypothetical protein